jgi:hypothetical protein
MDIKKFLFVIALSLLIATTISGQDLRARKVTVSTLQTTVIQADSVSVRSGNMLFASIDSAVIRHAAIGNSWDTLNIKRYVQCSIYRNVMTEMHYSCISVYLDGNNTLASLGCSLQPVKNEFTGAWEDCLTFNIE